MIEAYASGCRFWRPANTVHIRTRATTTRHLEREYSRRSAPRVAFTQHVTPPELPVLVDIARTVRERNIPIPDLRRTLVVSSQHMLLTTGSLYQSMIDLGVQPKNIYATGKYYSAHPAVEAMLSSMGINLLPTTKPPRVGQFQEHARSSLGALWSRVQQHLLSPDQNIERLIVMGEDARLIETMPESIAFACPIAGIVQTAAGLRSEAISAFPFPLIDVASSAAKKRLESHLIAAAILKQVKKVIPHLALSEDPVFGVIGNGAIGKALTKYLLSRRYKVVVFDENEEAFENVYGNRFFRVNDIETLIVRAECIFGCTGKDVTANINVSKIATRDKIFVSCSSEDLEFLSLLREISQSSSGAADALADAVGQSKMKSKLTILRGGTPINFTGDLHSVPAVDIQLTRGLMLGGFMQAAISSKPLVADGRTINQHSRVTLDPYIQQFVVGKWCKTQPRYRFSSALLKHFRDVDWIRGNSGGMYHEDSLLKELFADPTDALTPEVTNVASRLAAKI